LKKGLLHQRSIITLGSRIQSKKYRDIKIKNKARDFDLNLMLLIFAENLNIEQSKHLVTPFIVCPTPPRQYASLPTPHDYIEA